MQKSLNCIIVDDEPMAREILQTHLEKIDFVKVVALCKNALEAFSLFSNEKIDVVFLDINMPEVSGLSLAKSIHKNIKVIFTTAYREYAVDGFDLEATDYLLKPIAFERLLQAIQKVRKTLEEPIIDAKPYTDDSSPFLFVRSDRKMVKIDFSSINYIESLSDYVKIHMDKETVVTRETITSILSKLPISKFLRIHRSYIISISKIKYFTNEYVEVDEKALPISRSYKESVLNKLESL